MRRHLTFACEGTALVATLDLPNAGLPNAGLPNAGLPVAGLPVAGLPVAGLPVAGLPVAGLPVAGLPVAGLPVAGLPVADLPMANRARSTGLLLVTGGNETRAGAWAGQAQFAAAVAAAGYPVLRFDRRGCGDSEGENREFRSSQGDIAAALATLRSEQPHLTRVVAMGNCDAASALMLSAGAGADGLILTNPWTFEDAQSEDHPPEAVRSHYRNRLKDLGAIKRLLTGQVAVGPLLKSLLSATRASAPPSTLAQDMAAGLARFAGPVTIAIAERDRTGLAFLSACPSSSSAIRRCPGASHSFVEASAREWLLALVVQTLREIDREARLR